MKAVVFDFDGTLTNEGQNIWKLLWEKCGDGKGDASLRKKLYKLHRIERKISRAEWFNRTADVFKGKQLTKYDIYSINSKIKLMNGAKEVIEQLHREGYNLYIVSGGLKETILTVLGSHAKYFADIQANVCSFDANGVIKGFYPTKYDFEGKADYIELLKKHGYKEEDIVYIGNSGNDEWVHATGCKTICINPANTNFKNVNLWDRVFINVTDLRQIFIKIDYTPKKQNEEYTK